MKTIMALKKFSLFTWKTFRWIAGVTLAIIIFVFFARYVSLTKDGVEDFFSPYVIKFFNEHTLNSVIFIAIVVFFVFGLPRMKKFRKNNKEKSEEWKDLQKNILNKE